METWRLLAALALVLLVASLVTFFRWLWKVCEVPDDAKSLPSNYAKDPVRYQRVWDLLGNVRGLAGGPDELLEPVLEGLRAATEDPLGRQILSMVCFLLRATAGEFPDSGRNRSRSKSLSRFKEAATELRRLARSGGQDDGSGSSSGDDLGESVRHSYGKPQGSTSVARLARALLQDAEIARTDDDSLRRDELQDLAEESAAEERAQAIAALLGTAAGPQSEPAAGSSPSARRRKKNDRGDGQADVSRFSDLVAAAQSDSRTERARGVRGLVDELDRLEQLTRVEHLSGVRLLYRVGALEALDAAAQSSESRDRDEETARRAATALQRIVPLLYG